MEHSLSSLKAYLESQFCEHAPHLERVPKPFITLSRQAGAGGITISRKLSAYLKEHDLDAHDGCGWSVFDKNIVEEVLKDHRLSEQIADFMPEDKVSEIDDILDNLFGLHPPAWTLVKKTSETLARLASLGRVILVGRGAHLVCRKLPGGTHVRLIGSFARRVAHIQEYFGFDREHAVRFIEEEDRGRRNYLRKYFGRDIDDPLLYDMVLNTDEVSYEEAARLIAHACLHPKTSERVYA